MKIVIAPNAFKETLTAPEAARAIERGLRAAARAARYTKLETDPIPIADGGDGTAEALRAALGGRRVALTVTGPLGERVESNYVRLAGGRRDTAIIELAAASGLWRVPQARRNPLKTTTFGTGELAAHALAAGARRIVITVGGSATVDGGLGIVEALGFRLLDRRGRAVGRGGAALEKLARIEPPPDAAGFGKAEWIVVTDVDNPLTGEKGAAAVFGPQKGATPDMVRRLDAGLAQMAEVVRRDLGRDILKFKGGGAAGGAGAGLMGILGARVEAGAPWVLDMLDFDRRVAGAQWLITGEGRLDFQSLHRKAPAVAAQRARHAGARVLVLAGSIDLEPREQRRAGIDGALSLVPGPCSLDEALTHAGPWLERIAEQAGRLILA